MSTDIIRFPQGQKSMGSGQFSEGALLLYAALTLPLMTVTLLAYFILYKRVSRQKQNVSHA